MPPVPAPCEAAVIITSTHTQTLSCAVERHQRYYNQIQRPRLYQSGGMPLWFEYVVAVGPQRITRLPGRKPQAPVSNRMQYGKVALLAHGTGLLQHRQGVELAISSQIQRNTLCTSESSQGDKPLACITRSTGTAGSAQLLALCANPVSDIKGVVHEGREGILRLCRCRFVTLNRQVQVGTLATVQAFRSRRTCTPP